MLDLHLRFDSSARGGVARDNEFFWDPYYFFLEFCKCYTVED
jgi:hypothetical protein